MGLVAAATAGMFIIADIIYQRNFGNPPNLKDIWWLTSSAPLLCGVVITLGCGGAGLGKRIISAAVCGILAGILYTAISATFSYNSNIIAGGIWRIFIFAILSTIGALITELYLPE